MIFRRLVRVSVLTLGLMAAAPGWRPAQAPVAAAAGLAGGVVDTSGPVRTPAATVGGLRVQGNRIVNAAGETVRLHGVNRSGSEYMCIANRGFFDGPSDLASVQAIASWHANAVRVPLNESCWLAINGAPAAYSGAPYQQAIKGYVDLLSANGLVPILELHWSGAGKTRATGQQPMPNRDHTVTFWTQVAQAFKGNSAVIFDLFNEPYPDHNRDTTAAWRCWRDGGACPGVSFMAAGMQELVTAVRGTGATNIIMLGGVRYANVLTGWTAYRPNDPLHNLAVSWHVYNFNPCITAACFDAQVGPVADQAPVIAGEIGEDDCGAAFVNMVMDWLDARGQGYLAWVWDTWGAACNAIALISNYDGTPQGAYGRAIRDRLLGFGP